MWHLSHIPPLRAGMRARRVRFTLGLAGAARLAADATPSLAAKFSRRGAPSQEKETS